MRWDYFSALVVLVGLGVVSSPVALKQTTCNEVIRRAAISRTRPKRATTSPGLGPPTGPLQTFVIKFTATGQSGIDNTYGYTNPSDCGAFCISYGGTFAQAPVFYLDANGWLVRVDTPTPQYAYMVDFTGRSDGVGDYVTFGTTRPSPPPNTSLVKCTISSNSELYCHPDNPNTQETVQAACQGAAALAILKVGTNLADQGCFATTLVVSSALP